MELVLRTPLCGFSQLEQVADFNGTPNLYPSFRQMGGTERAPMLAFFCPPLSHPSDLGGMLVWFPLSVSKSHMMLGPCRGHPIQPPHCSMVTAPRILAHCSHGMLLPDPDCLSLSLKFCHHHWGTPNQDSSACGSVKSAEINHSGDIFRDHCLLYCT